MVIRSVEQNGLCEFGRGNYEEHFCQILLNLSWWLSRCWLPVQIFLFLELAAFFFSGVEMFVKIL